MEPRLAWIGTGNMGQGMCKNLVAKGNLQHPLLLQNRTPASTHALSARLPAGSTRVALTLAEVVTQSDLIFTCVGDDRAVLAVFEELSLQPGIGGKVLVDCSTVHPDTTTRLAEIAAGRGAQFVACPVFGAPAVAEAGMLVAIAAGPAAAVQKLRPYLTGVMARATLDFSGEEPGKASCLKVIGCTMLLNMIEALAEGHVLAEKTGLGPERLHLFVEEMFGGAYAAYSKRMLSGDYFTREPPLFSVDLARKDAGHALKLAQEAGTRMMAVELADGHLAKVQKAKGSKGDIAGIYGVVREEGGLKYENSSQGRLDV